MNERPEIKVELKVISGPRQGRVFTFTRHEVFLIGRAPEAHCCLAEDELVSRHHCLVEILPPTCRLRDLRSKNGTYVNGVKYGGRSKEETGASAVGGSEEVELKDGDAIQVGQTRIQVSLHSSLSSSRQKRELEPKDLPYGITEFEGYELIKKLGEGGLGAVYLARDKSTHQEVALKALLPRSGMSEKVLQQFSREVEVMRGLKHPNLVEFYDQGYVRGFFFLVMEYLAGGDLVALIRKWQGRVPLPLALPIMRDCLEGLACAHQHGFVHRDLKPQNILLAGPAPSPAKIGDFGLAKNFENAGLSGYTQTGECFGTLYYMPPEQVYDYRGAKPTADVFSLGATFYALLTGRLVHEFPRDKDPLLVILEDPVVPLQKRNPSLPLPLATVIDTALQPRPENRFATAQEMKQAFLRALSRI